MPPVNLKTRIDFNGRTTSYDYDLLNRLTKKTPDPFFGAATVSFGYTNTGQRSHMIDASGTTTYQYDLRDRLTSKATPQGTLMYTYDAAGNLNSIRSTNAGGTSVDYSYDVLNRLSTVRDNRLNPGTTSYAYDNTGSLKSYLYPNGVTHTYAYNALNRLTNLTVTNSTTTLASYAYTLAPAGNRTKVIEFGGRTVDYTYDALYRLTQETITGDPDPTKNGAIGYVYDPVGNRKQRTSTISVIPAQTFNYDTNDRLTSDSYDANGNTAGSGGDTFTYEFENRLITKNGAEVVIIYDGDGNRVAKTVGGVTTRYLVDDRNPTGYAQVLEEIVGGAVALVYTYGLHRISQSQATGTSFYGYDGHGSVRQLFGLTGHAADTYTYDASGLEVSSQGSTLNDFLYGGEQFDRNLFYYYLRARYYHQNYGRFLSPDSFYGQEYEPASLHRYLYAGNDPVNNIDPTGQFALVDAVLTTAILGILAVGGYKFLSYTVRSSARDRRLPGPDAAVVGLALTFSPSWLKFLRLARELLQLAPRLATSSLGQNLINRIAFYSSGLVSADFGFSIGCETIATALDRKLGEQCSFNYLGFNVGAGIGHGVLSGSVYWGVL